MEPTEAVLVAAQAAPISPFDPALLFQQGPLVGIIGLALWWIVRREDWWSQQLAAERALNARLQEQRVEDQKVLIPLGTSMVAATEQSHELIKKVLDK